MSGAKDGGSSKMTAAELMALKAEKLRTDPVYRAQMAAAEAERQVRVDELRVSERPIVEALGSAGVEVDSVWDLVNTSEPYPAALPVLMEHLERGGYPGRVMESLGRALAVRPAVVYWDRLKVLYVAPRDPGEEDGVGVALAACATREHLDDLIGFLSLVQRGDSRIYFIRPILKVGGQRGRELVESMSSDPTFGKEASALLKKRKG